MKPEEISKKIYDIKLELLKEFGNVRMGRPIKNSGKIREMRRTLARLETLKRQKGAAKKNG